MNLDQFKSHMQRLERLTKAARSVGFRRPLLDESLDDFAAQLRAHVEAKGDHPAVALALSEL